MFHKIARVTFNAVFHAELHVPFVGGADHGKNSIDYAVFKILRIFLPFNKRNATFKLVEVFNGYGKQFMEW